MDSNVSPHITSLAYHVCETKARITPIYLADGSTMSATDIGSRRVCFQTDDDQQHIKLTDILVVADDVLSVLSIPALVKKDVGIFFKLG